mgnify:CR=1 FL=1
MTIGFYRNAKRGLAFLCAVLMLVCYFGSIAVADNEPGYYLVGSMNGWAVNADYKLTQNTGATVTEYMITLDLAENAEFKVVWSKDGADRTTWYPDGDNYKVTETCNYTVYFRPDYNGGSD